MNRAQSNHSDDRKTCSNEMEMLVEWVSAQFGGATVKISQHANIRSNSRIYTACICSEEPFRVAIKRCLVPGTNIPDCDGVTEQYLALKKAAKTSAKPEKSFRVPEAICLFPEQGIYVMSWADGESLTKKLGRPDALFSGKTWFKQVGTWLGNFHLAGPLHEHVVNTEDRITVVRDLARCPIPHPPFKRAIQTAIETEKEFISAKAHASWLHGDCKTDNFILNKDEVFGIDLALKYENSIEYDLAQFLNNLYLLAASPRRFYLKPFLNTFERAFSEGYGASGIKVSNRYLTWLRLTLALSLWEERVLNSPPGIRTFFLNTIFTSLANHLVSSLVQRSRNHR